MATAPQKFYCLWQEEHIREKLFGILSKEDICSVRLANSACCNLVTKRLFIRTNVTFTSNTFTKPCRIQALSRIGHHIEHITFSFAHSEATFLPPLIHPLTGREINFLYTPHTSMASVLARPKYGNSELGEILTQQYPPLFHAATNVPSFMNAMKHVPNLRHLTIKTPGQDPKERYRRDIVDYALISLRISLERAPLVKLTKLSLSGVHPSAFNYLRHNPGFGCVPSAGRRWGQIRKLYIAVESWDFYGPSPGLDQLKIIDDYIRGFSSNVEKFTFTWLGRKGPCPLALAGDPLFAPPRSCKKLFNEVTSPMSPLPPAPVRRPIHFPRLRYMQVRNATMNAPQLRDLVTTHQATVREFDFENVALLRGGSWDEALAPLTHHNSSDVWSQTSLVGASAGSDAGSSRTAVSSQDDREVPEPSAAVAAASKELLEMDLEGFVFGENSGAEGVEEWRREVGAADEEKVAGAGEEDDDGLASDIAAAKEASQSFSTKLKKRRIRKRRKKHSKEDDGASDREEDDRRSQRHHHSSRSRSRHKHSRSDDRHDHHHRHRSHSRHHHHHRRHHSEELPPPMPMAMPEVIGSDDESFRPSTPRPLDISAPILDADPLPVMLQPTVYDPSGAASRNSGTTDPHNDGLSSVQLTIERELLAEAEDAAARTSALRRAKEAVLSKLSREFCRRGGRHRESPAVSGVGNFSCAAQAAASSSMVMGLRLREGLFGKSSLSVVPDHRSLESQSALVPLMFSRS